MSCTDIGVSGPWYEKLLGVAPVRESKPGLVEFQFTDSAEVHVVENAEDAGHSSLTLGVLPMEPERKRLIEAGLSPSPIEAAGGYFSMYIRDPDDNAITFAAAEKE